MRVPHLITLAQIDRAHFITACRHGVVHLNWGQATVRFSRNEFETLASLVERVVIAPPPSSAQDGALAVTARPEEDSELRVGSLALLFTPGEWHSFAEAILHAAQQLRGVLASGSWDEPEEQQAPPNPLEGLTGTHFSDN